MAPDAEPAHKVNRQPEAQTMTDADIRWHLQANPWRSPDEVVALALERLRAIADDDDAALVLLLVETIIEQDTRLSATKASQAVALSVAHDSQREERRVRERYHDVLAQQQRFDCSTFAF